MPHRGDEAVQGLPPLGVLDRDWAEVVSEPDGRDDPARVAVGDVLLQRERKKSVREPVVLLEAFSSYHRTFGKASEIRRQTIIVNHSSIGIRCVRV